jgi:DNA-binding protein H-NS
MKIKDTIINNSNKYKSRKTIDDLFDVYAEEIYTECDTNKDLIKKIVQLEENFENKLTEEQRQQFEKIGELKNENYATTDKNIFVYGFTLAIQLITESIS